MDEGRRLTNPLSTDHLLKVQEIYRSLRREVEHLNGLPSSLTWLRWRYLKSGSVRTMASVHFGRQFTLSLHRMAFDYGDPILLKGLIHHELVHIVCGSAAGHGPLFRSTEQAWIEFDTYSYHKRKFARQIEIAERENGRLLRYECPNCNMVILRTRPLRPESACKSCVKRFNDGIYSESYTLIKVGVVRQDTGEHENAPKKDRTRQTPIEENDERTHSD